MTFINYFQNAIRPTPFNLAVARIVLGTYLIWRVVSLDWGFYQEWPRNFRSSLWFLHNDFFLSLLPYQQWVLVGLLTLFIVGYKIRWTAGLGGLLLAHMLSVKSTIYLAGTVESLFVSSYLLLLFAFFHTDNHISADGIIRTKNQSLEALNDFLKNGTQSGYELRPMKWGLIVVGIMYLGSTWGKIKDGPLDIWLSGADLQRDLIFFQEITGVHRQFAQPLIQISELAWLGFVSTSVFQVGLIVAVLLGLTVTPFILGLIGFHTMVIATMGLYFIDMIVILLLFASFDRGYSYLVTEREIDLVYDEHCYFCARSLYLFKLLDINDTVNWYSQYDAPDKYQERFDVDFEEEMYVFVVGETHGGYHAFRQLLKQFWFTVPISYLMALSPVDSVGERVYRYVAENRDRYFVCSYEPSEQF